MMDCDDVRVKLCQQHVIKLDLETKAIIQDIQKCDGPLEELERLNKIVAEKIRELKIKLEELERFAKEQDRETNEIKLLKEVDTYRKQLTSTQALLRKANLMCQLTIEKNEKALLLDGGTQVRQRKHATKESMAHTASSITENLMSLSRLMAAQVQQSEQTMGSLVSSSKQVGDTQEELKSMGGHIQSSHKLLTKYSRRECTDKLLIFLALAFFFASVLYVVKKRLFD